jgi:hypothetical protein
MNQTYSVAIAAIEAVPRRQVGESLLDYHSRVAVWQSQYTLPQPESIAGALVRCCCDIAETLSESKKLTTVINGTSRERRNAYQASLMRDRRAATKLAKANAKLTGGA